MSDKAYRIKFGRDPMDMDSRETIEKSNAFYKWGRTNDFPFKLTDLYNSSPLHQGIINGKLSYLINDGFIDENISAEIESFLENGISDYSVNEVLDEVARDLLIFGGFCIKVVKTRDLENVAYIEHLPMEDVRISECEKFARVSMDFNNTNEFPIKNYPIYRIGIQENTFVLYFKDSTKRQKKDYGIYPKPEYISGLKDIESDKEISVFHLNELLNGFTAGTIINDYSGIPTTEEEKKEARKKADKFTGAENAGSVIVNFADSKETSIEVVHLNGNDLDKRYNTTEKSIKENILVAHSIPNPLLVGIKTEGQLGGAHELEVSFAIWVNTYFKRKQRIINDAFTFILKLGNIEGELKLAEPKLPAKQIDSDSRVAEALNNMSELVANNVIRNLTINEIRALANLAPIEGGDEIQSAGITAEFSKENKKKVDEIELFSKVGKPIDEIKVFKSFQLKAGTDSPSAEKIEAEMVRDFFDDIGTLRGQERTTSIMGLIKQGESVTSISDSLNIPLKEVVSLVEKLRNDGFIEGSSLTSKAERILDALDVPVEDFEIRYTYEKREGIEGDKIISTTRDFCRDLIGLNKAFTRQEIDQISAIVDRDVFRDRGGFYHNPNTKQTTPFCRHVWRAILTRK